MEKEEVVEVVEAGAVCYVGQRARKYMNGSIRDPQKDQDRLEVMIGVSLLAFVLLTVVGIAVVIQLMPPSYQSFN